MIFYEISKINDKMASVFNENVSKNIIKSWEVWSWQFVEKIKYDVEELISKFRTTEKPKFIETCDSPHDFS